MDRKATSSLPLIVFFGVILAFLMAFIFITLYNQQLELRVDEQAGALANDLAQTAFTALSGGQPILDLPQDLGGSPYDIEIQENSIFVVKITGGKRGGSEYSAVVNATIIVENEDFSSSGQMYFMHSDDTIIVSATPIQAPTEYILPVPSGEPPRFYNFAKDNPKAATAIIAAYFDVSQISDAYDVEDDSVILSADSTLLRVQGYENEENVGLVTKAWVVENIENYVGEFNPDLCENVENAYLSGWLYSPQDVLNHLRSRTWLRENDNVVVVVPSNATIRATAATTNVSTFVTWRVEWQGDIDYVIHYQAMPWWENDEMPGFVFQSEPKLKPVV